MARSSRADPSPRPTTSSSAWNTWTPRDLHVCVIGKETRTRTGPPATAPPPSRCSTSTRTCAGVCWAVIPDRKGLNEPKGQFDTSLGMYAMEAALMALHVTPPSTAIWPTPVLQNPNGMAIPQVVQPLTPRPATDDRHQRHPRLPSSIPPTRTSRSSTASRPASARPPPCPPRSAGPAARTCAPAGGSQIMTASLDFVVAEPRTTWRRPCAPSASSPPPRTRVLQHLQDLAHLLEGRPGPHPLQALRDLGGGRRAHRRVPIAGSDLNDLVINGGQRLGQETMSAESFMEIDPSSRTSRPNSSASASRASSAFFTGLQTMASDPAGPW